MKKIYKYLLSLIVLTSLLTAVNISTTKQSYNINENIVVNLENLVHDDKNWVGIYPKGASNAWGNVIAWDRPKGETTLSLDSVEAGEYEARLFYSDQFILLAKVSFSVGKVSISTNKQTYTVNENIVVNLENLAKDDKNWVGIYPKDASNAWSNMVTWDRPRGETTLSLDGVAAGEYEARLFYSSNFTLLAKTSLSVGKDEVPGVREVASTPLNKGTIFASPNGQGNTCSIAIPCHIEEAFEKLGNNGGVLFLRGGEYLTYDRLGVTHSGTEQNPIIIESYPGEWAVINGRHETPDDFERGENVNRYVGIWVYNDKNYVHIRKLEIKNMPDAGIKLESNYSKVEGCRIHGNHYNGIHISDGVTNRYHPPYHTGYNLITDNYVYNNSDAGMTTAVYGAPYNNGNNSDGISVTSSKYNTVTHNEVYDNSDDGIDTYMSNYATITWNISHHNGKADGNGGGFKTGSRTNNVTGLEAKVYRNIAYSNKKVGFNYNGGNDADFKYNTSWNEGETGFITSGLITKADGDLDLKIEEHSIAENNIGTTLEKDYQKHSNNSWQKDEQVEFISTNPESKDFLRPIAGSVFESMGVYAP